MFPDVDAIIVETTRHDGFAGPGIAPRVSLPLPRCSQQTDTSIAITE